MKPICLEVRELIIRAKQQGKRIADIAYLYDVGIRTVNRICSLYRDTGTLAYKVNKGRESKITETMKLAIYAKVDAEPDCTLSKIIDDLQLPIKEARLHKLLKKRGYSYKKKLYSPKINKEKMLSKRELLGRKDKHT